MIEAVAFSAIEMLSDLAEQTIHETLMEYGVGEKIDLLKSNLRSMQAMLKDADHRGRKGDDEIVRHWVKEVRDLSDDIEDVVERFLLEVADSSSRTTTNFWSCMTRISLKVGVRKKLMKDITKIETRIADITESQKIQGFDASIKVMETRRPFQRHFRPANGMVGFNVEMKNIMRQLFDPEISLLAIVGPGGIGKTTLVDEVLRRDEVQKHFRPPIWLSVPRDFRLVDLLKKTLEKLGGMDSNEVKEESTEQYFIEQIWQFIGHDRYLIILDDVWSKDVWDNFKVVLHHPMNGSKVLMTTRFLDVAMNARAQCSRLDFFSDEESLELLLKEAFPYGNSSQNYGEDLGDMPVKLAKKCGGLPLALNVVGGLLAKKTPTFGVWDKVMRTFDWHSDGKECMNILATSYEDLPNYVKSCFMSLACFPKNQEIQAKWLIRLWVAEDFLREKRMIIPEAGAEAEVELYLGELVNRCMIQVTKWYSNGSIKACRIHDVYRELAIREAKERNFVCIYENDTLARDLKVARRVAFHYEVDKQNTFEENMLEEILMPNVRSFYMSGVYVPIGRWLKFLKVLELRGTKDLKKLPTELTYMIFLRYLGLRSTGLTEIPKAIGNLSNLQTLDVRDTFIQSIHDSFWTIKSLRHVHVSDPLDQVDGPPPRANLENIQSLKMVRVRKAWRFGGLPLLPLIRKLGLSCHRITDIPDSQPDLGLVTELLASLENLVSLVIRGPSIPNELIPKTSPSYQNIKSLFLCGSERSPLNLDGFQIPPNLIKLTLQQFILNEDPMPILEKLGDLKTLCLKWLTVPPKMICSAGSFSQLERFEMVFLSGLEEWSIVGAMPLLNKLLIGSCSKLNALPDLKNLNKLHEFTLSYPSQKLKEMIIQNPTYNAPNSFQWNKCGSAEFRLSAMS